MSDTTYTEISNDYSEGYEEEPYYDENGEPEPYTGGWIAGVGDIVVQVEGNLAERVRSRTGKSGVVTITEQHWDSGYCVTCSYEEIDFVVKVDGESVYDTRDDGYYPSIQSVQELNNLASFNAWLNGEEPPEEE